MEFEELLEQVAPLIDLELGELRGVGSLLYVQFDIQTYLLGAMLSERRSLLLTQLYRPSLRVGLDEILSLTRSDRRHLVND